MMGNSDGFASAMAQQGQNKTHKVGDDAYFSFAFGSEIALFLDNKYFILNCDESELDEIKKRFDENSKISDVIEYWKGRSEELEINDWSANFDDLVVK